MQEVWRPYEIFIGDRMTTLHKHAPVFSNSERKSEENKGNDYLISYSAHLDRVEGMFSLSLVCVQTPEKKPFHVISSKRVATVDTSCLVCKCNTMNDSHERASEQAHACTLTCKKTDYRYSSIKDTSLSRESLVLVLTLFNITFTCATYGGSKRINMCVLPEGNVSR